MILHACARGLLAGALMSVMALAGGTGVARADPDDVGEPSIIDQIITQTPALLVDPADEGGPSTDWDGVGMYCENLFARCQ